MVVGVTGRAQTGKVNQFVPIPWHRRHGGLHKVFKWGTNTHSIRTFRKTVFNSFPQLSPATNARLFPTAPILGPKRRTCEKEHSCGIGTCSTVHGNRLG